MRYEVCLNLVLSRWEGKCAITGARRCNCRGCQAVNEDEKLREVEQRSGKQESRCFFFFPLKLHKWAQEVLLTPMVLVISDPCVAFLPIFHRATAYLDFLSTTGTCSAQQLKAALGRLSAPCCRIRLTCTRRQKSQSHDCLHHCEPQNPWLRNMEVSHHYVPSMVATRSPKNSVRLCLHLGITQRRSLAVDGTFLPGEIVSWPTVAAW